MKKIALAALACGLLLVGCETKSGTGAIVGGALGAGTGAIIGHDVGGALIGGAVGAVAGGLVGAALDEQDRKIMNQSSPQTVQKMDKGDPLTVDDVIKLSQGGVSDNTIIRYVQDRRTTYNLTQAQISKMQDAGVSQRVINYMVNTGR